MFPNRRAFLDTIAISELGKQLIALSDNGYNVIVGSMPQHPILFNTWNGRPDYRDHPRRKIWIARINDYSTAAGRYQLLMRYFDYYKKELKLADFSPASQDAIALRQIAERCALDLIDNGRFEDAITSVSNIWASLPGAGYKNQRENKLEYLAQAYISAGGVIA